MDRILALTRLPDMAKEWDTSLNDSSTDAALLNEDEEDNVEDDALLDNNRLQAWLNSLDQTTEAPPSDYVQTHKVVAAVSKFLSAGRDDKSSDVGILLDEKQLARIGLPVQLLKLYFKLLTTTPSSSAKGLAREKRDMLFVAPYLNTFGLHTRLLVDVILQLYDKHVMQTQGVAATTADSSAKVIAQNSMERISYTDLQNVTREDLQNVFDKLASEHASHKEVTELQRQDKESVCETAHKLLRTHSFDSEVFLSELSCLFMEPVALTKAFVEFTTNESVQFNPLSSSTRTVQNHINERIKSRKITFPKNTVLSLSQELLHVTLPERYVHKDGSCMPHVDHIVSVLMGKGVAQKKTLHDILYFTDYAFLTTTDSLLSKIDTTRENIRRQEETASTEEDLWGVLIREWQRVAADIVTLHLVRVFISELASVRLCNCRQGGTSVLSTRGLSSNTIYIYKSTYYTCTLPLLDRNNDDADDAEPRVSLISHDTICQALTTLWQSCQPLRAKV